jgi:hypothetical protein
MWHLPHAVLLNLIAEDFTFPERQELFTPVRALRMAPLARELYPNARGRGRPPFDGSAFCWSTKAGGRHRVTSILKEILHYVDVLDVSRYEKNLRDRDARRRRGTELSVVGLLSSPC